MIGTVTITTHRSEIRYEVTQADDEIELSLDLLMGHQCSDECAWGKGALVLKDGLLVIGTLGTSATYRVASFDPGRLVFLCERVKECSP